MTPLPEQRMRVTCPECGTNYRVDPGDVPEQGASAVCKKCGHKFKIQKSAPVPVAGPVPAQQAENEGRQDTLFTCPRCGRRQLQPFTCYFCGSAMTPKEPAAGAAPESAAGARQRDDAPQIMPEMGKIVVRTGFASSNGFLHFARPRIVLDGQEHNGGWGVIAFDAPAGEYAISVDTRFLFWTFGRGSIIGHVSAAEKMFIDYTVTKPFSPGPGNLRKTSLAEGILWQMPARQDRPSGKGHPSRKAVLAGLLLLGPFGLIALWKSDQFSNATKMVITAILIGIALLVVSKLSVSTRSLSLF